MLDADRDAVLREAVDEVGGAVERIDDPDVLGLAFAASGFLGEEAMVRIGVPDDADDRLLGRLVHLRHAVVGAFRRYLQPAAAIERGAVDDRAGLARGANGKVEHGMHTGGVF